MIKWILGSTLISGVAFSQSTPPPEQIECTARFTENQSAANFIRPGIQAPYDGATTVIRLNEDSIEKIHFSDGGVIPLQEVGAKLQKSATSSDYSSYFSGTHQSPTSLYTGSLNVTHYQDQITALIQVHRHQEGRGQSLYSLTLDCVSL